MGLAKRKLEEIQEKQFVGLFILIKASVLEPCEFHEDVFLSGDADIEDAYRLGNAKWSKGELREVFLNRRDMTDNIKSAFGDNWTWECPYCAKLRRE